MSTAELKDLLERPTHVANAGDDELAEVDDEGPGLDEAFEDEATRETLKAAVRRLPERDQVIVALYFFEASRCRRSARSSTSPSPASASSAPAR